MPNAFSWLCVIFFYIQSLNQRLLLKLFGEEGKQIWPFFPFCFHCGPILWIPECGYEELGILCLALTPFQLVALMCYCVCQILSSHKISVSLQNWIMLSKCLFMNSICVDDLVYIAPHFGWRINWSLILQCQTCHLLWRRCTILASMDEPFSCRGSFCVSEPAVCPHRGRAYDNQRKTLLGGVLWE